MITTKLSITDSTLSLSNNSSVSFGHRGIFNFILIAGDSRSVDISYMGNIRTLVIKVSKPISVDLNGGRTNINALIYLEVNGISSLSLSNGGNDSSEVEIYMWGE